MKTARKKGFTLIELLITVAIISILILVSLFIYQIYMTRARDGRRKADLAKLQRILEDYLNDNVCYPDVLECDDDFSPYLAKVFCDPINSGVNVYYYSVSSTGECKKWYKIFTNLEYEKDPIIEKIGCTPDICGPFNYLVASSNVEDLVQQPGEVYPPSPPGVPSFTPAPTEGEVTTTPTEGEVTTTPTEGEVTTTPTATDSPTSTPTPTGTVTLTPTPTPICPLWSTCVGQGGFCNVSVEGVAGAVCSDTCDDCTAEGCLQPYPACVP